ncbi:unnamed protein product [Calicophoron daubneyi]|uniref:adenylate cyclase n=1 Tax=Calicophoron daubneyi TaxID=300641 RepID=A0AAV2TML9_CALDB
MLPLSLEVSVCLVAVYITLSEGLDKLYDQVRAENRTYVKPSDPIPWVKFDLNRLITEGYRLNPRSAHILAMRALEWTFICFAAVYVRFWNNIRRRFVFFKLGKSVQARAQRDTARRGRVCWIEAIVPSKVSKEYQRLLKENECLDKTEWIYIQSYESVTMLFADIVGFTKMSSGLTASQVVNMLGSLVRQFDALCEIKHCEKLGLIGDCYYCVSGCPDHFRYHARSCTEMGLGMCEILKSFNQVFGTKINIRVGVHTGRVHAAVIGAIRFHYDVYSYDAIIANELEQTGKPGLVHISQTTYDQVHKHYRAIPGPELVINREDTFGWARRVPETVRILTYFIEPSSTNIRQTIHSMPEMRDESPSNTTSATLSSDLNWSSFNSSSGLPSEEEKEPDRQSMWIEYRSNAQGLADIKMSHQTNAMKLKRDIALIDDLRADPANHRLLFTQPPLTSILSQFRSPEIEWHYQLHIKQAVGPVFADSPKLARICDAVVLLLVNTLIIAIVLIVNFQRQSLLFSPLLLTLAVIICWILCFTGTHYPDRIESPILQTFYNVCVHPVAYECILGIYTLLPAVITSALVIDPMRPRQFSEVADVYFTLMSISTFTHCIPSSSAAWGRGISAALTLACGFLRWGSHEFSSGEESRLCLTGKIVKNGVNLRNEELISFYQAAVSWTLIWILSRDTERTSKLCFFVHREAEIESEAAEIAAKEANVLLYNIIPKYVFCDLERIGRENLSDRSSSLRYAVTHEMIAVAFISISNFLSTLYREDHEGGAASLRMLHRIICSFDSLLENFQYVEKIKSIRENYLVAAGLDRELVRRESKKDAYMVELMRYCMMARDRLHNFSQTVLHDEVDLVVKIGYNVGPATAGIIGTAKPHYDIWGDTVNVASRMCYTGIPGMIQVTEVAREELENTFYFSYRGEFFVKGKGHMRTYICDGGK